MQRDLQHTTTVLGGAGGGDDSRLSLSVSHAAQSIRAQTSTTAPTGLDALREKARHALKKLDKHCDGVAKMEATYQQILDTMKGKLKYEDANSERRKKIESYVATIVGLQNASTLKAVRNRLGQLKAEEADAVLQFTMRLKALLETTDNDNRSMASELEDSSKKLTQLMSGLQKLEPGRSIPPSLRSSTGGPNPAANN